MLSLQWQHFFPLFSLTLLFPASMRAETPTKPAVFAVQTARGPLVKGTWRQLKSDGSVRLGEGVGTGVPGSDVVSIRRIDLALPPLPMEDHLILANGDRIPIDDRRPLRAPRLVDDTIRFRNALLEQGKDASVPLAAVSILWYIAPDKTVDAEKLRRRLASEKRKRDTICLRNGDVVAGVLTSLDGQKAIVEVDERRVTVKVPQVAYIAFNTELADALRPKGAYTRLILTDSRQGRGARMTLTSASADDTTFTGTTVFGAKVHVPVRDIAALDLHQDNAVYLSELKESKYIFEPFLDVKWPFAVDGNVAEHDLRLAGSTYDKGISMHSHSRLTYRLSGSYRRFEALAGLDDKDGQGGEARLRVLADGKTLLDRALTSKEGSLPIRLNMEGVRELTLEVDFGRNGDVRAVVNWVDARLVK